MIELEADPAGEQRHDELVEADALLCGHRDELGVEVARGANEDAATGNHATDDSASAIDNYDSAGNIIPMSATETIAQFNGKCQDRCGLRIHAGHDTIEPGHYGWRHADCEQAHLFAWVRDRLAAGDSASDIQIKLLCDNRITGELRMAGSVYALDQA